jgi:hypothetical protein
MKLITFFHPPVADNSDYDELIGQTKYCLMPQIPISPPTLGKIRDENFGGGWQRFQF